MVGRNWTDIDVQGRRMNKIVKLCESMISNLIGEKEQNHDLILAYIDRLVRTSSHQAHLTDMALNLSLLRKLAEKKYLEQITDIKLKELS